MTRPEIPIAPLEKAGKCFTGSSEERAELERKILENMQDQDGSRKFVAVASCVAPRELEKLAAARTRNERYAARLDLEVELEMAAEEALSGELALKSAAAMKVDRIVLASLRDPSGQWDIPRLKTAIKRRALELGGDVYQLCEKMLDLLAVGDVHHATECYEMMVHCL